MWQVVGLTEVRIQSFLCLSFVYITLTLIIFGYQLQEPILSSGTENLGVLHQGFHGILCSTLRSTTI